VRQETLRRQFDEDMRQLSLTMPLAAAAAAAAS